MPDPDNCPLPPDPEPTDLATPDTSTAAEAGAWLSVRSATAQLGISERTFYRRPFRKRDVGGGQVEYWVPGAVAEMAVDRLPPPLDPTEAALALYNRVEELAAARQAPLLARIEELAAENGRLRERLEATERVADVATAERRRGWWARLLGR